MAKVVAAAVAGGIGIVEAIAASASHVRKPAKRQPRLWLRRRSNRSWCQTWCQKESHRSKYHNRRQRSRYRLRPR
jgi:hypothetical protein